MEGQITQGSNKQQINSPLSEPQSVTFCFCVLWVLSKIGAFWILLAGLNSVTQVNIRPTFPEPNPNIRTLN